MSDAVRDWFFMVGEPLGPGDRAQAAAYLEGMAVPPPLPAPELVRSWPEAARWIRGPEWDPRWAEAEGRERERLLVAARSVHGTEGLLASLSRAVADATGNLHGAAAVAAARLGGADEGMVRAAAGAASEAVYLAALARSAGQPAHAFVAREALFAGGHWPLGVAGGVFLIF